MLNLRVFPVPWFRQRTKIVFAPGFPSDSQAEGRATATAFLRIGTLRRPVQSCRRSKKNEPGRRRPLTPSVLETFCSLPAFANRGPDDCGANSNSAVALCGAACGTHDRSGVLPPGNACRRGPRGRPSCGNHGGPDHRFAPGRCLLEVEDEP
jgi:hypothetical protein